MSERRSLWREYLEALLVAGLFLGFTNTFVLKTFFIPSGSMEDTLLIGDHLVVDRFIFGSSPKMPLLPAREPRRGDIVVFRSPQNPELDLVKRLIGLPGDKIEMRQKQLFVNDRQVDDHSFAVYKNPDLNRSYGRDNFGPIVVPPEEFFFLGDNRDMSLDSRFWGTAPRKYLKGRPFLIYWSFGGETPNENWPGYAARAKQLARTAMSFVTKTRWTRTFLIPR